MNPYQANCIFSLEKSRMPLYFENNSWRNSSSFIWMGFLFLAIIVLFITGIRNSSYFLESESFSIILRNFIYTALPAAMMLVIFCNGGVDLSVGPISTLTAMVVAFNISKGRGLSSAIIYGLVIALAAGLVNGLLAGFARLPCFLATLATMFLAQFINYSISYTKPIVSHEKMPMLDILGWLMLICVVTISILWFSSPVFHTATGKPA